jgi:hypothetical protein
MARRAAQAKARPRQRARAAPAALQQRAWHPRGHRLQRGRLCAVVLSDGPLAGRGRAGGGGVREVRWQLGMQMPLEQGLMRAGGRGALRVVRARGSAAQVPPRPRACFQPSGRTACTPTCTALPAAASSGRPRRRRPAGPPAGGAARAAARASRGWAVGVREAEGRGGGPRWACSPAGPYTHDTRQAAPLGRGSGVMPAYKMVNNAAGTARALGHHLRQGQAVAPMEQLAALDGAGGGVLKEERGGGARWVRRKGPQRSDGAASGRSQSRTRSPLGPPHTRMPRPLSPA